SAFDIADGILAIAANMLERPKEKALRGTFHMTASGEASWADFAAAIIAHSESHGGPTAKVEKTTTDAFGFKAKRPAHSRLLNDKLAKVHGVRLPPWEASIGDVVARVLADEPNRIAEK
ncbi:MAG: sugar nucleotide-binding protein, partial [Pseudomonadota bacterium]